MRIDELKNLVVMLQEKKLCPSKEKMTILLSYSGEKTKLFQELLESKYINAKNINQVISKINELELNEYTINGICNSKENIFKKIPEDFKQQFIDWSLSFMNHKEKRYDTYQEIGKFAAIIQEIETFYTDKIKYFELVFDIVNNKKLYPVMDLVVPLLESIVTENQIQSVLSLALQKIRCIHELLMNSQFLAKMENEEYHFYNIFREINLAQMDINQLSVTVDILLEASKKKTMNAESLATLKVSDFTNIDFSYVNENKKVIYEIMKKMCYTEEDYRDCLYNMQYWKEIYDENMLECCNILKKYQKREFFFRLIETQIDYKALKSHLEQILKNKNFKEIMKTDENMASFALSNACDWEEVEDFNQFINQDYPIEFFMNYFEFQQLCSKPFSQNLYLFNSNFIKYIKTNFRVDFVSIFNFANCIEGWFPEANIESEFLTNSEFLKSGLAITINDLFGNLPRMETDKIIPLIQILRKLDYGREDIHYQVGQLFSMHVNDLLELEKSYNNHKVNQKDTANFLYDALKSGDELLINHYLQSLNLLPDDTEIKGDYLTPYQKTIGKKKN